MRHIEDIVSGHSGRYIFLENQASPAFHQILTADADIQKAAVITIFRTIRVYYYNVRFNDLWIKY